MKTYFEKLYLNGTKSYRCSTEELEYVAYKREKKSMALAKQSTLLIILDIEK